MLSNDELNIFKTDSLTVSGLVNNNDNEFNFPQPLLSSEDTFTVLPLDEETLRFSSQLIDDIEVNTIEGTPGRDNLVGTEGDDIIIGFQGRDTITGGDGNDTFLYTSIIDAGDIITDFEVGQDKIDFTEVLDGMGLTGDDPIESGYVGFRTYETDVIVTIHPNGAAGRRRSFLRLQGLADDAVDNESFLADVLGLNSDIEVPVISAELLNDTGEDDSDGITSDPTIIGTINTESEVVSLTAGFNETSVEDFVDVTAALLEDGSFELNQELLENVLGDTLTNGTYSLKLQATDSGGNLSEVIEFEFTFDLDVSVPIVSAELLNDTGEDDSDGITSDPTIIGTINTESEVVSLTAGFNETSVEDFVDVTAALLEDGSFELNQELLENVLGDTLTNGTYSLKLQATDSGGNLSEVIEFEFTFDLDVSVPIVSAELLNDTGEDDSDGITSDPTIIGTINTESEVVSLTAGFNETSVEDFVDVTAALLEDGSFELNQELLENVLGDTLTNGTYSLKLQATDSGGNLSEVIEFEFTFDLDVSVPIVSAELLNDTGEDDSDGITSDPTIIGTINTESEVVSLTAGFNETSVEDFVDVTAALLEDGSFELNQELLENVLGDTLTNGTYSLKLQATDSGGNLSEVIEFEFTFDLDVSVPIVSAELLNDTGGDDSDGITSDPTIIGTINTESEVVSLTAGFNETSVEDFVDVTAALLEDGSFELNQELLENVLGDTLTNGTYSLKLQATDSGGNLSEVIEFEFTFDLDVSVPIVSAELLNDTGGDDSDGITSDPTIIGTINTESEVVSLTAGFNETSVEDFVDVTAALLEDGSFELNQELLENVLGDTLTNGTYSLKLQATDSGGNLSEVIEFEFTFDLDVSVPIVSAELLNDTGEDDSDNITSDPTIIGTINAESEIVSLTAGFNDTLSEDFVDVTAALLEDGSFELDQELLEDVFGDTLTNGTYTLKLQATDTDGNLSEVIEFEFTLNIDSPIISVELLNDTGEDNTDNITSDSTIVGTINIENEVVSLTAGFNETSPEDFVDVTAALLEDGTFELNQELLEDVFGDTLTNGTYNLKLQATDSGGNLSEIVEFEFTLDLDVEVPIISAELASDTGADDSDGITSDPTIIGTVNTESEVVSLTAGFNETPPEDFVDITDALLEDGTFELNQELLEDILGDILTDGTYTLKLQVTDSDGNLSEIVEFEFTLDSEASEISVELANDTGADDSDGITSDPTIIGTINTDSEIVSLTAGFNDTLEEDFVDITDALSEDGTFELDQELLEDILGETLTNDTYFLNLQSTGSNGIASEIVEFEFTLDTVAPEIFIELANDTGESDTDKLTAEPTIIANILDGSDIVSLTGNFNNNSTEEFIDLTPLLEIDGSLELTPEFLEEMLGDVLTDGTYTLYLQAVDEHNISSDVIEFEFTFSEAEIDRPGPEILSLAEIYGLDTYPDAITLPNTGTRQLSVKVDGWLDSPELTIDIADISYTVADENVLSVNDEGLVTATGVGETTVTVEYGDASATIPVLVDEPEPGATIVDENGGIVSGSDGELVMIPPESFLQETSVNITSKNSQELSLDIPENYSFVTGFELEIGDQPINHPVQLAIPAPEDVEAGTEVFFMVKGEIPDAEGNLNETWVVQESGIVGEDGIIRTQSPPWQGVQLSGEYSVVIPNFEYSVAHIELALASTVAGTVLVGAGVASIAVASRVSALQNSALQQSRKIGKINPLFFGQRGLDLIGFGVDTLATVPVLINAAEKSVTAITIPQVGLPYETESGVQLNPGQFCCSSLTVDLPTPPAPDALALTKVEVKVPPPSDDGSNQVAGRVIFLEGENFGNNLDELEVNFHLGDKAYPGTILPELSNLAEGKIAVVSDYVPYGEASVSVEKTITSIIGTETIVETETIQLPVEERVELAMTTMTFSNRVNLINARNPLEVIASNESSSQDLLLASIPVGSRPRYTAATSEASRAYVTLEGGSALAVLDLQGFRQLDTQPDVEGVNPIALPDDSSPRPLIIDPLDNYAYVGDGNKGQIYVIDINPNSPDYNQHVETIDVGDAPSGLKKLAISSDGKRLFATTPDGGTSNVGQILVVNIDPEDRPVGGSDNVRKWHQQIGAIDGGRGTEGITATSDELKMAFTNRSDEPKGYGVLTIVNNDPLNFEATTTYAPMSLGPFDSFDVNEAVDVEVIYDEVTGTDYAFVAGFNMRNFTLNFGSFDGKSNVGIIKDALGDNPQLVAGTQRIPFGNTSDLALSSDNRFLFAAYPGIESTFAFDVREMISTINDPTKQTQLETQAIDVVNPNVSVAADLQVVSTNPFTREIEWKVPDGSERGPISTGTLPWGVEMASKGTLISLEEPDGDDLTPTLKWEIFRPGSKSSEDDDCDSCLLAPAKEEDIKSVKLYMSVFPKGQGLLPGDDWDELKDKPETDLNPQRILTAKWENGGWKWVQNNQDIPNASNTFQQFTLPDERMLTGGQTYHWAVEVEWKDEVKNAPGTSSTVTGDFETNLPEIKDGSDQFSSVTVLTRGVMPPESKSFTQQTVDAMAEQMEDAGAAVMRYDAKSGKWNSVTYNDSINGWTASPVSPVEGKPLVLLADWMNGLGTDNGSFRSAGVAEAAADGLFSSLVDLDFKYGGTVGGDSLYDENGDLIRSQGAVFNSPLHFVGFGQGAVVNTEIVQRLGTYFPNAGGRNAENRDLHFTTVDPFEYNPETVPQFEDTFARMLDPEIVIWDNVTYADNYYQQQGKNGDNEVIKGKPLTGVDNNQQTDNKNHRADNSQELEKWAGFDPAKASDNAHHAAVSWYGGTANLNESQIPQVKQQVFRRFGDLLAEGFSSDKSWFVPGHINANLPHGDENAPWEGIGTGWFYSVNGGGKDVRPYFVDGEKKSRGDLGGFEEFQDYLKKNRRSVSYDNTYTGGDVGNSLRGDFAVPTLFNGNFDVVGAEFDPTASIPGWSVDSGSSVNVNSLPENLVEWSNIGLPQRYRQGAGYNGTTANYALKLDSNFQEITHNPFVIPEWGNLRFDVYAPEKSGKLNIQLEVEGANIPVKTIDLALDAGTVAENDKQNVSEIKKTYGKNVNSIGYGREGGFETFQLPFQKLSTDEWKKFIGKPAKLTFTLEGNSEVFIDNVFFKSAHVKLGNPTNARWDATQETPTNLLVEKPGYTVSYNTQTKTPNWVSWQVNKTWTVPKKARLGVQFIDDPFFSLQSSNPNWPEVNGTIFTGLGMDRGHLIPDRDRNRNAKDTIETYMGSNLIAQSMDNNRRFNQVNPPIGSAWFNIEKLIGNGVEAGKEYYVVAGSLGNDWSVQKKSNAPELLENPLNQGDTKPKKFKNNIFIPEWTWKSAIALPKPGMEVTSEAEAFVYITPNHAEPTDNELPIKHPLNDLLDEERGFIESREEWRDPETWRVSLQQLQDLLNSRKDPNNPEETDPRFNFQFDFLSHITNQSVQEKLMKDGEYVIF